jgi:hypothetical protein
MANAKAAAHESEQRIKGRMQGLGRGREGGAAPTGAPAVGTVKGGYRFKGGNPADKNSWEKV